jgi:signal peptidase I
MKIKNAAAQNAYFYRGTSMTQTFKKGDYLFFKNISITALYCGDVIVFNCQNSEENKKQCVHRIIGKSNKNLITRGDNNPKNDEDPVIEENLVGKVTHYERNGKIYKVWNGQLGLMRTRVLHGRLHVLKAAKYFLRKPYRMLKKTGIIYKLWRPEIEKIYFETPEGPLIKYIHKSRTVANYWIDSNLWWFRRPYDFVIRPRF